MKYLLLFLLPLSLQALADNANQMPRTTDIIQEEQQYPAAPEEEVNLEKMNTSPNPVQNSEDESSDAILNPEKNPEPKQMQEENSEDEDSGEDLDEDQLDEEQDDYQSGEV